MVTTPYTNTQIYSIVDINLFSFYKILSIQFFFLAVRNTISLVLSLFFSHTHIQKMLVFFQEFIKKYRWAFEIFAFKMDSHNCPTFQLVEMQCRVCIRRYSLTWSEVVDSVTWSHVNTTRNLEKYGTVAMSWALYTESTLVYVSKVTTKEINELLKFTIAKN